MNTTASAARPSMIAGPVPARTRADYEDFLYQEAALLDEWRLDEWLALFSTDAIYEIPTAGALDDADSAAALFYVADDYGRLGHRVKRLNQKAAHSEWPRSDCARMINNVRILRHDGCEFEVGCTFVTYRSKHNITDMFVGHMRYVLRDEGGVLKIASKRVFLDINSLNPQGRVSIIL